MKTTALIISSLLFSLPISGQNLLLNPSFEDPVSCPPPGLEYSGLGTVRHAMHWVSPVSSADYLTPCYSTLSGRSVPTNSFGFQMPKHGTAYVGINCAVVAPPPYPEVLYREYVEGTLSAPLERDSVYLVEFFVSRADRYENSNSATDRMGAYFHKDYIPPLVLDPPHQIVQQAFISAKPQIENPLGNFLTDSVEWMRICGYFKAAGGEQYMTIGNFYDNANTAILPLYPNIQFGHEVYSLIDDITVEKVSLPYEWGIDRVICTNDSLNQYSMPNVFDNILWSTGDTAHTISIEGPGTFWVTAALGGCLLRDTFEINLTPPPEHLFPNDTLTVCSSALPVELSSTDCCTQLLWSTGDTTISTSLYQPGLVWLSQYNLCGSLQDSFWLQVDYPKWPDLGRDTALCDTTLFSKLLQATPGMGAYLWNTGETASAILVEEPGLYTVETQNACGIFRDSLLIEDLRQLRLQLDGDTSLCLLSPLAIAANSGFDSYLWSTGEQTTTIEIKEYGLYSVTATNACGAQQQSMSVLKAADPQLSVDTPIEIYLGDSVQLQAQISHNRPLSFIWSPPQSLSCLECPAPIARPFQTTEYLLLAVDDLGCAASVSSLIRVLDARRVYLPNVFRPNENGENDEMAVALGQGVDKIRIARVYDRWGELMAEQKDLPFAPSVSIWDGSFRGRAALPGVYTVAVDVLFLDGETRWFYGDVTLLR